MLAGVAMAAGILGRTLPFGSLIPLLQPTPPSRQFDQPVTSEKAVEQMNVGAMRQRQEDKTAQLSVSAPDTALMNNDVFALRDAPPTKSEARRLDANAIMMMVKNGIGHMANGNIVAARMVLKPAAEMGDPVAAFEFAQTYDPLVLRKLKIEGGIEIKADVGLALTWYRKAKDLGSAIAEERLDKLGRVSE
jgi:TPR repeat protein